MTELTTMISALAHAEVEGYLTINASATRSKEEQRAFVAEHLLVDLGLNDE